MKQTILKLLLFINSILLIAYMGLTAHADFHLNTIGVIPLFLSSLLLIDVTYVSSCNIRENKTISLFCGLLALESWYIGSTRQSAKTETMQMWNEKRLVKLLEK